MRDHLSHHLPFYPCPGIRTDRERKNFNVKAKEFHACGLELSHLYNELRIFKTLKLNPTPLEQVEFARKASESQFNGIWSGITKTYDVAYKTDFQSTGSA